MKEAFLDRIMEIEHQHPCSSSTAKQRQQVQDVLLKGNFNLNSSPEKYFSSLWPPVKSSITLRLTAIGDGAIPNEYEEELYEIFSLEVLRYYKAFCATFAESLKTSRYPIAHFRRNSENLIIPCDLQPDEDTEYSVEQISPNYIPLKSLDYYGHEFLEEEEIEQIRFSKRQRLLENEIDQNNLEEQNHDLYDIIEDFIDQNQIQQGMFNGN